MEWERVSECVASLTRRCEEAGRIEEISRQTLPLLEEIRDNVDDQARVNRAIGEIDGLRAKMNELGATYDLITELTQSSQLKRFQADRKISAAKILGLERQRRQVSRDVENVRGVMEAAGEFQRLMRETISLIERENWRPQRRAA